MSQFPCCAAWLKRQRTLENRWSLPTELELRCKTPLVHLPGAGLTEWGALWGWIFVKPLQQRQTHQYMGQWMSPDPFLCAKIFTISPFLFSAFHKHLLRVRQIGKLRPYPNPIRSVCAAPFPWNKPCSLLKGQKGPTVFWKIRPPLSRPLSCPFALARPTSWLPIPGIS